MKRVIPRALCIGFVVHLAGCGLFDPPSATADLGEDGGGGTIAMTGSLCALSDLRDYRTCATIAKANVAIVAYGATTTTTPLYSTATNAQGQFELTIPAIDVGTSLLIYANDPSTQYFASLDHFTVVAGETVAVPLVATQTVNNAALAAGIPLNATLGILFAYMVNTFGVPQAGAKGALQAAALGPFYDGSSMNTFATQGATGNDGLLAYFNVPVGLTTFTLSVPAGLTFQNTMAANTITFATFTVIQ